MNFAVVEILDKEKYVVDFVESIDTFIYKIKQLYSSAVCINGVILKDIEKHDYFSCGLYILAENNMVSLLEKTIVSIKGYLYNTTVNKIEIKKNWEFLEIKKGF